MTLLKNWDLITILVSISIQLITHVSVIWKDSLNIDYFILSHELSDDVELVYIVHNSLNI
jgi:hypothetical protein